MKVKDVLVLQEAVDDLNEGRVFYDLQELGVGNYFWDCMVADIESLIVYAGIHSKKLGLFQMFAKRFPYAIYYEVVEKIAYVVAILPMRKNPAWISKQLGERR
ncbi:type II toxin-antitoxin system RelE/ParE family toxin [uncultured Desulfosarcina sp.]|uniref:type II toxin-antitoxin system RelE/ParE family toxin n=1 Tax=uncultured Desulfosarcina sp. TaxID=218289 RepID=UPI0029C8FC9B|nr:type II toxin-antitoxin system RelE/ParE family toxin [uncultured Desulfosarcina sp.]